MFSTLRRADIGRCLFATAAAPFLSWEEWTSDYATPTTCQCPGHRYGCQTFSMATPLRRPPRGLLPLRGPPLPSVLASSHPPIDQSYSLQSLPDLPPEVASTHWPTGCVVSYGCHGHVHALSTRPHHGPEHQIVDHGGWLSTAQQPFIHAATARHRMKSTFFAAPQCFDISGQGKQSAIRHL